MDNIIRVVLNLSIALIVLYISIKFLSKVFDRFAEYFSMLETKYKRVIFGAAAIAIVAWPVLIQSQAYMLRTSIIILMYVVLALSLNFVLGFTGQLSMGHAAFYGIGAYVTALLSVNFNVSFWIALPLSAIVAGCFGFILGMPTLRLKGDYLAITTIGFGEIVRLVLINWIDVTKGPAGIPGIASPNIFGFVLKSNVSYYYIILIIAAFTVFVSYRLLYSRLGRGLIAVRDNDIAAEAMGINTTYLKVLAFVLGASIAGMAGSFFASFIHYVNPDNFTYMESVVILCMVVLGGLGNITGVIFGAALLALLPEALRDISTYRYAIYGMLLILMMIIRPQGMISLKGGTPRGSIGIKRSNKILWGINRSK